MNPLNTVRGAITTGVVLAIVIMIIVALLGLTPGSFYELGLARWLHILSAITWIGLLFYFNLVQTPGLAAAAADKGGPGGTNALTLGHGGKDQYGLIIGIGAWLGTIMLVNVWVFIWPNQKKILGIVPASDAEKAAARKTAGMASRTNFVLSIPVILCMGSAFHGLPF